MLLDQFDLPILRFITGMANHSALTDRMIDAVMRCDVFGGVTMMGLLWATWFNSKSGETLHQTEVRQQRVLIVLIGSVLAVILSRALQHAFHIHQRPLVAGLNIAFPTVVDPASLNNWNSFPSDHAMLFFAMAVGLWRMNRCIGTMALLWTSFVICLPRLYLGFHYPSDILAGAALGTGWMLGFERLPLQPMSRRLLKWGQRHPAIFYGLGFLISDQIADLFDDVRTICVTLITALSSGR